PTSITIRYAQSSLGRHFVVILRQLGQLQGVPVIKYVPESEGYFRRRLVFPPDELYGLSNDLLPFASGCSVDWLRGRQWGGPIITRHPYTPGLIFLKR